jgi:hypothetical protein
MVLPAEKQRSRTLQHINTLMENGPEPTMDQAGNIVGEQLPAVPEKYVEDFKTARDTFRLFWQENGDYRKSNPAGWQRTMQYYEMLIEMEAGVAAEEAQRQLKVKMAGSPPPPAPDPQEEAAKKLLMQDGAEAVQRMQQLSEMPPQPPGVNVTPQVTATGKIIDAALKLAQAQAKGQ